MTKIHRQDGTTTMCVHLIHYTLRKFSSSTDYFIMLSSTVWVPPLLGAVRTPSSRTRTSQGHSKPPSLQIWGLLPPLGEVKIGPGVWL